MTERTPAQPVADAPAEDLVARVLEAEQAQVQAIEAAQAAAESEGLPPGPQVLAEAQAEADVQVATPVLPATAQLAARREALGMSREDVAAQLKFAARQIQALEEGRFGALPAGTFARGMVRSYARLLKVDPAQVLDQLGRDSEARPAQMEDAVSLRQPVPFSDGGRRVNLVYALLSIGVLVAVAVLGYDWYRDHNRAAGSPTPVAAPLNPQSTELAVQSSSAPPVPAEDAVGPPGNATPAAIAGTAAPAGGKRRIAMRFERESWVEIKDRSGVTLLSQLNPGGSERAIEGEPPFSLVIGNAASVRVTYNEQPVDLRPHFKVDVARFTLD
jgi:cytoskeleton protein RodZ